MQMTKEQFSEFAKSIVQPMVKDICGTSVAEIVEAQMAKAAATQSAAPPWLASFMDGMSDRNKAAIPARDKGLGFGRIVRAVGRAKLEGTGFDGAVKQLQAWGDKDLADGLAQTKALAATNAPAGGYLVPVQQSSEIIDLRRAATVIRSSGVRTVPLPTGNLQIPKIATGATGGYIGENTNLTKSQQVFGQVNLSAKKLGVLVPILNDLLRNSSPDADSMVRDDIVRSLAVTEDAALLRSDGTAGAPKGLLHLSAAANRLSSTATATLATVTTELGNMLLALMQANAMPGNWTWVFAPRTWKHLTTVQNANGFYVFRDEMLRGNLWGFPFKMTTGVPVTLTVGANADCSELYLFAPTDQIIGDNLGLAIDVSSEAAYHDGSAVVAAFSLDQTVIRAITEHDFNTRYPESIAVTTGVRWGV